MPLKSELPADVLREAAIARCIRETLLSKTPTLELCKSCLHLRKLNVGDTTFAKLLLVVVPNELIRSQRHAQFMRVLQRMAKDQPLYSRDEVCPTPANTTIRNRVESQQSTSTLNPALAQTLRRTS